MIYQENIQNILKIETVIHLYKDCINENQVNNFFQIKEIASNIVMQVKISTLSLDLAYLPKKLFKQIDFL